MTLFISNCIQSIEIDMISILEGRVSLFNSPFFRWKSQHPGNIEIHHVADLWLV